MGVVCGCLTIKGRQSCLINNYDIDMLFKNKNNSSIPQETTFILPLIENRVRMRVGIKGMKEGFHLQLT